MYNFKNITISFKILLTNQQFWIIKMLTLVHNYYTRYLTDNIVNIFEILSNISEGVSVS